MGFFSSVADNLAKGFDWGVDKASAAATQVKDGVVAGARATRDAAVATYGAARDGVVQGYQTARDGAVRGAEAARDGVVNAYNATRDAVVGAGRAAVGKTTVAVAGAGAGYLTRDPAREQALTGAVDKRADYTPKEVCQTCVAAAGDAQHPNPNDGRFMGADCALSDAVPAVGKQPAARCAGCTLPRVYFTNGINNDEKKVCETITALAEMMCADVVGIYNATYADPTKVAAPTATPWSRPSREDPPWYRPDKLVAAAVADGVDRVKHAAAEKAGGTGLLMDVLDCLDNIDSAGTEAAAASQRKVLLDAMSKDPPTPVTMLAHSQGGLITQEGLVMAKQQVYANKYAELVASGMTHASAKAAAAANAAERVKHIHVTSFGTAERGWAPGPTYAHYTNTRDPVPALIRSVQENRPIDLSDTGGPVTRFTASPSFDPMAAHGMAETYLPEFGKTHTAPRVNGQCCG